MHIIELNSSEHEYNAISIGCFDGVHLGHRKIIDRLNNRSKALKLNTMILSFNPSPKEFINNTRDSLSNLRTDAEILRGLGINYLSIINFNAKLRSMEALDFMNQYIKLKLKCKYLVVGKDFACGKSRLGNVDWINTWANNKGLEFEALDLYKINGVKVSTTDAKKFIRSYDFEGAKEILGRPYSLRAMVVKGFGFASKLGYPTANLNIKHIASLGLEGIFVAETSIDNGKFLNSILYIGDNPTLLASSTWSLEVHILDYKADLIGKIIEVRIIKKLRSGKKYYNFDELKKAIRADIDMVHVYFKEKS